VANVGRGNFREGKVPKERERERERERGGVEQLPERPGGMRQTYAERRRSARGGGGRERLNLPGEFMTDLFKGCLVVLNPCFAALAFPSPFPPGRSSLSHPLPPINPLTIFASRPPFLPFLFSILPETLRSEQAELLVPPPV
jgi:hypothetical protein